MGVGGVNASKLLSLFNVYLTAVDPDTWPIFRRPVRLKTDDLVFPIVYRTELNWEHKRRGNMAT